VNHESPITTYEQLEKAWELELIRNGNSKVSEFVQSKRVQAFFNSDFSVQERFMKETAKQMRDRLLHHKMDWEKTARMYRAAGLFPWAEQCDVYARNPNGKYPNCDHADIREGMFKYKDSQGQFAGYDDSGYSKWLAKVKQGREHGAGGASKVIDREDPKFSYLKDEKSNAELGTELSGNCNNLRRGKTCNCEGKGHPDKLIAKIKQSMQQNPEFYRKPDSAVY